MQSDSCAILCIPIASYALYFLLADGPKLQTYTHTHTKYRTIICTCFIFLKCKVTGGGDESDDARRAAKTIDNNRSPRPAHSSKPNGFGLCWLEHTKKPAVKYRNIIRAPTGLIVFCVCVFVCAASTPPHPTKNPVNGRANIYHNLHNANIARPG